MTYFIVGFESHHDLLLGRAGIIGALFKYVFQDRMTFWGGGDIFDFS